MKTNAKSTAVTMKWLMATDRHGARRIEKLSWGRLSRIYNARTTDAAMRKAIEREARACGYRPATILSLNAWN